MKVCVLACYDKIIEGREIRQWRQGSKGSQLFKLYSSILDWGWLAAWLADYI